MTYPVKQHRILRLLQQQGPLTTPQIAAAFDDTAATATCSMVNHLRKQKRMIMASGTQGRCTVYTLTDAGRDALSMRKPDNAAARIERQCAIKRNPDAVAITAETKITLADASPVAQRPHYDGAELRPFEGRPGSMRAFGLPSRGIGA